MKWTRKYVKLTLKNIKDPWYIPEKNKRYGLGNVWYIVREDKPGRWKKIYSNINTNSGPFPLGIQDGGVPDLDCFSYEELTKGEAFILMV